MYMSLDLYSRDRMSLQRGQLGHGDLLQRNIPTIVKGLNGKQVIAGTKASHRTNNSFVCLLVLLNAACHAMFVHAVARMLFQTLRIFVMQISSSYSHVPFTTGAGGKHHSAIVTSDGASYTFGSNLHGQCGTGTLKSKDKVEGKLL